MSNDFIQNCIDAENMKPLSKSVQKQFRQMKPVSREEWKHGRK